MYFDIESSVRNINRAVGADSLTQTRSGVLYTLSEKKAKCSKYSVLFGIERTLLLSMSYW